MKRFNFRLEKIRHYRDYLEKDARIKLANARNEYIRREEEVRRLTDIKSRIARRCSNDGSRGISVPAYRIYQAFLQKLGDDLERAYGRLKEGKGDVITEQRALKEASIKKKTLETLRDLQLEKYMEKIEDEGQKVMDEQALMRRGEIL